MPKKKAPREKRIIVGARDQAKLDVSIRIQRAYQLGHEAGGTATKGLQGGVASLQEDNNTLRSQLKSAEESEVSHTKLLARTASESKELRRGRMCHVCFEQQRCIALALLPCAHYPMCYQCLLVMGRASGENPIACPICWATTSGHLKLSPGDLPCAADKRAPEC